MTFRRRNRVLCLHGPTQSAASLRAALKPVCDRLESNWEFHFLDAPFIVPDEDEGRDSGSAGTTGNTWITAAVDASRLVAVEAELATARGQGNESTKAREILEAELTSLRKSLQSSEVAQQIWTAHQQAGGADAVEALISTKVAKSMSRDWTVTLADGQQAGIDVGLAMIGDYMREQGTFHAVVGCDSGGSLSVLLQSLLSHPRSSSQAFPTYFAQLPKGVKRMPRMGGWEEEPPAPDDPRLGAENLTKDYVPAQKPFEAVVSLQMLEADQQASASTLPATGSLGRRANDWVRERSPILCTRVDGFASHSLAVRRASAARNDDANQPRAETLQVCSSSDDIFDPAWSAYLASWLKLALESCAGSKEAGIALQTLRVEPLRKAQL